MKVLVTGGLGNLGLWVVSRLLDQGMSVDVVGRREKVIISNPKYLFIQADISDLASLRKAITCHYDVCIHLASYNEHFEKGYEEKALKINAQGTENLCRIISRSGVGKFIYFSTFHVYGQSSGVVTEESLITPDNIYGMTHYFAEKYVELYSRKYQFDYCTFRLTNSYGCPKDLGTDKWYLLVNDICKQAYEKKEIKLNSNGKARRDFIWMGDVVSIIVEAMSNKQMANTNYNLSANNVLSVRDVVNIAAEAYRKKYSEEVEIYYNESDESSDTLLDVKNDKLMSVFPYEFKNKIFDECFKIFALLEVKA